MSGLGGIAPQERDLSRRRDRQAAVVLTVAAAVDMLIFFPLGLVLGLVAAGYSYVSASCPSCSVSPISTAGSSRARVAPWRTRPPGPSPARASRPRSSGSPRATT